MPHRSFFRTGYWILRLAAGLFVGLGSAGGLPAHGAPDRVVEAELVAAETALVPGRLATVALRLAHPPHWHTYWKNPGAAGEPTRIEWRLPAGFTAGPILWPVPRLIELGGLFNYGYEDEVFLLTEIAVPASAKPGTTVELAAHVTWLGCKTLCVPGQAKLGLVLPVALASAPDRRWAAALAASRAALPPPAAGLTVSARRADRTVALEIEAPGNPAPGRVAFFPADSTIDPQGFVAPIRQDGRLRFEVRQAESATVPTRLSGLLVAEEGWTPGGPKAVMIDIPVTGGAAPAPRDGGLAGVLALAFLGGLILNLMPCVFPVLGIKILGFVQQAGDDPGKVKRHGLAFTAGVLASFWALGGGLLALRAGGAQLGWGYQLQVPGFVFFLAVVMLVFALSLSGVFEIGGALIGAGAGLQARRGLVGTFFSGVLATVVATPCSAPFLAPALGAALVLPPVQSLAAFTAIALGLAVPYLGLSFAPAMVRVLPRPGAWMETFKQFMAFPLYATVGYLVFVLAGQVSEGLLPAVLGLTLVALAVWVLGRWATPVRAGRVRWAARVASLALALAGLGLGLPRANEEWIAWSPEAVERLRAQQRIVYVDFTARWCATCQVNKAVVFGSAEVQAAFRRLEVAKVRGDWTGRDPAIAAELQRHGRAAVPVNLVYLPGRTEPVLLPELLTPGIVLEAVTAATR